MNRLPNLGLSLRSNAAEVRAAVVKLVLIMALVEAD